MKDYKKKIQGLILLFILTVISIFLSEILIIGSKTIAILFGVLFGNIILKSNKNYSSAFLFAEKSLLSLSIILLGTQINFQHLEFIDLRVLSFILLIMFVSVAACLLIGRFIGLNNKLSLLVGLGNSICGTAAIASSSKILNNKKEDVVIAIAIINFLGMISIFIFPIIINFFPDFTNEDIGFLIGSTIQAFGQVTATGYIINNQVGEYSSVIKMIRISMLGPILILLTLFFKESKKNKLNEYLKIPFFVIGFAVSLTLTSLNIIPQSVSNFLNPIADFTLTSAMIGIGYSISINNIFKNSKSIMNVALLGFIIQILLTIFIIKFL